MAMASEAAELTSLWRDEDTFSASLHELSDLAASAPASPAIAAGAFVLASDPSTSKPRRTGRVARSSSLPWRALRVRIVLGWIGAVLFVLTAGMLVAAAQWRAPEMMLVTGGYAGTGCLVLVASVACARMRSSSRSDHELALVSSR
jgi:hypothetical protein